MKIKNAVLARSVLLVATMGFTMSAWGLTGIDVGGSGKTYASSGVACALHPVVGMSPMVQAGLYNPKKNDKGTVYLNGLPVATVAFASPDAFVWLANGFDTVTVNVNPKYSDNYSFDASLSYPLQPNLCIPDTRANFVDSLNDLETAQSGKSSATITPGCAFNALTGRAQPFVNLFDNGDYLLNVSVNNVPLTQLSKLGRTHTPVFLSPGLNVISAANAALSVDYFVRNGGSGTCTLP